MEVRKGSCRLERGKGKGSRTVCSNRRLISLLSVPCKVFAHVLLERLRRLLTRQRRPQQSGFTPIRSTIDAVVALRLLAELHREFGKPLQVAYIDIKAAFDSADRQALWKALHATGTPQFLIQLIQDLHTGTTSRARVGRKVSKTFYTSAGVRQGCILAPALFCLAIDWIMSRWPNNLGITLGDAVFTDLGYADDAVLFTQDSGRWQADLRRFDEAATTTDLYTSWEKTKLLNIGHGPPPQSVSIDLHPVAVTDQFVYLCSNVDCWLDWLLQYRHPTTSWSCIFGDGSARPSLASEAHESCYEAEDLHNMCPGVLAVGLHGAKTWTLLKEDSHDVPKTHSWHSMEWLHHQQGCIWQHKPPKHSQHHGRSPSLHLRSHPSPPRPHTSTYDSEARREYQIRRHTTPRLESPSWQATDHVDEPDCAGHRTLCCWRMRCCWRSVYMEGATTHSRLRAAVSEWVSEWVSSGREWNCWRYMSDIHIILLGLSNMMFVLYVWQVEDVLKKTISSKQQAYTKAIDVIMALLCFSIH